jgi:hypothetical protein
MKCTVANLGISGAILAAALLAACGGGGGGLQSSALPSAGGAGNNPATHTSGTRITLTVPRGTPKTRRPALQGGAHRNYVSIDAQGLQIAISSTGSNATTTTEFVDISSTSPLCTPLVFGTSETTCSFTIPTVAANETIVATEVDQTPTNENATTGFGTGFLTSTNILAVGTTSVAVTGGVTNVSLGLNPVAAQLFECGAFGTPNFSESANNAVNRLVVTAGVPVRGQFGVGHEDGAFGFIDVDPTPLPFVDVNGSPTPITLSASSSDVTLAAVPNPSPAATPPLAQTASIPNDGFNFFDCEFIVDINVSANLTAPATITVQNNLTATSPISARAPYPSTVTYTVIPLSVTPATASVSVSAATTATVTGSDFEGRDGMFPSTNCVDTANPSQVDANVTPNASINSGTWLQAFTITPTTTAGTCTFTLEDDDSGVVTTPVTVTVNP